MVCISLIFEDAGKHPAQRLKHKPKLSGLIQYRDLITVTWKIHFLPNIQKSLKKDPMIRE
jgi:hypothetical protein